VATSDLPDLFRRAFRRQAASVTVVSYVDAGGRPSGMTATAVCSVSVAPPTLLVCVNRAAQAWSHLVATGRLGVNILALPQHEIANHCSRPGEDKTLRAAWLLAPAEGRRTPVLKGALAHLDCEIVRAYPESTHTILIGQVTDVWLGAQDAPLIYLDGAYSTLDQGPERSYQAVWDQFTSAYL
jgi:flavin reductase (DIM6/NTAB) family NADH-FMN oxidoreductase RutF